MSDIPLKRCKGCPESDQWHPATSEYFRPHNGGYKYGLYHLCRKCEPIYAREYNQTKRVYRTVAPEKRSQLNKAYNQRRKERLALKGVNT